MKNAPVLLLLLCAGTSVLHAQNTAGFHRREISIGPEYAITVGKFRKGAGLFDAPGIRYHYGIGGSVKYLYRFKPITAIENPRVRTSTYEWMMASGAAVTVSAVPFFLVSHKYKKMARVAP